MARGIFHSPRSRISWAKRNASQVKKAARRFFARKHYQSIAEIDPELPEFFVHKIKFYKQLPETITRNTVAAIENLRSALDQTAFAVATRKGRKGNKFPFADSALELENEIKVGCEYIPNDIVTLFRSFKPYKGGDDLLWALNKICNSQKHALIIPTAMLIGGMLIRKMAVTGHGPAQIMAPRWNSDKNEIVFAKASRNRKIDYDIEFALSIAFGEVEVVKGQPVPTVLRALIGKVTGIVDATEAEARRLGLM